MTRILRYLYSLLAGKFVVSESMPYGHYSFGRHKFLGRFHRLNTAKDFANRMSGELQAKVVVSTSDTNLKLFSYRPQTPNGPEFMPHQTVAYHKPRRMAHRKPKTQSRTTPGRRKFGRKFTPSTV